LAKFSQSNDEFILKTFQTEMPSIKMSKKELNDVIEKNKNEFNNKNDHT